MPARPGGNLKISTNGMTARRGCVTNPNKHHRNRALGGGAITAAHNKNNKTTTTTTRCLPLSSLAISTHAIEIKP
jgi:hypothetical protein